MKKIIKIFKNMNCKECGNDEIYDIGEFTCNKCGLVQSCVFSYNTFENIDVKYSKNTSKFEKWCYTNTEKSDYKLTQYTQQMCNRLNIPNTLIQSICNIVVYVMNTIKKYDSTKRSSVKDGIILVCIQYICKNLEYYCSHIEFSKKIKLDIKYITRAEKLIVELLNSNKIQLEDFHKINIRTPYEYIYLIIKNNNFKISENLLNKTKDFINECESNKLLLNYSPLSIGACCFYYILVKHDIEINIKNFSKLFSVSSITISKTFKILCENTFKDKIKLE